MTTVEGWFVRGETLNDETNLYHRILIRGPDELEAVKATGMLWGRVARIVAGNGPPCVRAYVGPLRTGDIGYNFTTEVPPSKVRSHFGRNMAVWEEGSLGVQYVVGLVDTVFIDVVVINDA